MKNKIMLVILIAFSSLHAVDLSVVEKQVVLCDKKNDYKACAEASGFYVSADGISVKQMTKAMSMANKACDAKNALGCKIIGELSWTIGELKDIVPDVKIRKAKAEEGLIKYKEACDFGSGDACFNLSIIYYYGSSEFVKKDMPMSLEYTKKSCELDMKDGCNNLGNRYSVGNLVSQNKKIAFKYYEKGCHLGAAESCYKVGMLYDEGVMNNSNPLPMFRAFERSCELKSPRGCMMLGAVYDKGTYNMEKNEKKSKEAYTKACEYSTDPKMKKMLCSMAK